MKFSNQKKKHKILGDVNFIFLFIKLPAASKDTKSASR